MNESDNSFKAATTTDGSAFRGRRVIDAMPVELLRDQRGVYGIGVARRVRHRGSSRGVRC